MKKIIVCLVSVFLIFISISCTNEDVGEEPEVQEIPAKDMYGYEFIFKAMTDYETFFFPEPVESERGDKILARYKEASDKFNCNVNVSVEEGTLQSELIAAAASGVKYTDLVDTNARTIYENIEYFMPLNQLPGFNIEDEQWGPPKYLETAKLNGENYGFIAYNWGIPYPQYIGNLFFMPSVMEEFNLVNPQELYEQKAWTWDKFREYSAAMTVKGATPEEDRYGFVISDEMKFPRAFIISNGGNAIQFDEAQNKYIYGLTDPKAQQALSFIKEMLDQGIGIHTKGDTWAKAALMFKEKRTGFYEAFNKVCFVNAELHLASDLGEPYSWVPYPCGPSGTYGVSTAQFWFTARFLGVVNNFLDDDELENNSILINYIFSPLEGEDKDSWKDQVKRRFFFDDQSFEYYIELFEGGSTDFSAIAYDSVWNNIPNVYRQIFSGSKSVSEAVLGVADKVNAELDKLINPYLNEKAAEN
jgi:ABC-type glycerol-3-phosphate transport system substrate-binding protein